MTYPFKLPTTHPLTYQSFYTSPVYPSLPLLLTEHHSRFLTALKSVHRSSTPSHQLPTLLAATSTYLAHLHFLQTSLHAGDVLPLSATTHLTPKWSTPLSLSPLPASHPGLDFQLRYLLLVHLLSHLHLAASLPPKPATPHLLTAAAIAAHAAALPAPPDAPRWPPDISPSVFAALGKLAVGDASLLAVATQDPYPAALDSAAPAPPPTKAGLLARICLAAETHFAAARALLKSVPALDRGGRAYAKGRAAVARARALRFLGIEAEAAGRVGEGIGWVRMGREVGAGTEEERVCKVLEKRWRAENDRVFFQEVVREGELVGRVPSGREVVRGERWEVPGLEEEVVRGLRAVVGGEEEVVEAGRAYY